MKWTYFSFNNSINIVLILKLATSISNKIKSAQIIVINEQTWAQIWRFFFLQQKNFVIQYANQSLCFKTKSISQFFEKSFKINLKIFHVFERRKSAKIISFNFIVSRIINVFQIHKKRYENEENNTYFSLIVLFIISAIWRFHQARFRTICVWFSKRLNENQRFFFNDKSKILVRIMLYVFCEKWKFRERLLLYALF